MKYTRFSRHGSNLGKIDREKGILKEVVIAEAGEAKGHGVYLDDKFLDDLYRMGTEYNDVGLKARFGHPGMVSDAIGTYVGRFRNFKRQEGRVVADLHLSEASSKSPNGNYKEYLLSLAEESPDMFGSSIVFVAKEELRYKEVEKHNGTIEERAFVDIEELIATDLVDEGAATSALFSAFQKEFNKSYSDYPESAVNNAKRGIKLNEAVNNRCATDVGKQRAQQIAKKEPLSMETIKRTFSYLSRAEEYYNPDDTEACGTISYLLWGGKSMKGWCEKKINQAENNYNSINNKIDKNMANGLLDDLREKLGFSTSTEVETPEATTEEVTEEVIEATVAENATTEETTEETTEVTTEETTEATAHVKDIVAEREAEFNALMAEKETAFSKKLEEFGESAAKALNEKNGEIKALKEEMEALKIELSRKNAKGLELENLGDAEVTEDHKKYSKQESILLGLIEENKGLAKLYKK